jgi:hypothetical protein
MTPETRHRALVELEKSEGWGIVQRELQATLAFHVNQLAKNRKLPHDDVEYLRGVIYALEITMLVPDAIRQKIEIELKLQEPETQPTEETP